MKPQQYVQVIKRLLDEGYEPALVAKSLVKTLTSRKAEGSVEDISRSLSQYIDHGYHTDVLYLELAHEVDENVIADIRGVLKTPKGTRVVTTIDPQHIGGVRALHNNSLFDATLETQLQKLRSTLLKVSTTTI
jgi:F0F1-type ATP synthase delta subunit